MLTVKGMRVPMRLCYKTQPLYSRLKLLYAYR